MELPTRVATLEDVSEPFRELYREDGEAFVLNVKPVDGWALENVNGLKSALQTERESARTYESKVKELEAQVRRFDGIDPSKAREAQKKLDELQDGGNTEQARKEWETREAQLVEKFQTQINELKGKNEQLVHDSREGFVSQAFEEAIAQWAKDNGGKRPSLKVLRHAFANNVDVEIDEGTGRPRQLKIKDDRGEVRVSPSAGNTGDMTLVELIREAADDPELAGAFPGSGASGTGADGRSGSGGYQGTPTGKISGTDQDAINQSLEAIAAGKVTVDTGS
jgi:hypothetical protein